MRWARSFALRWRAMLAGRRAAGELDEGEAHTADLHAIGAHVGRRPEAAAGGEGDDVVLIDAVATHPGGADELPAPVERYAAREDLDAVGGDGGAVRWQRHHASEEVG